MKHLIILLITLSSLYSFASTKYNIHVDTTQVSNENVLYKVSQDGSYVYLNLSTKDKKTAMSILRDGLTIYYDIKGKKKKDVFVKYPYSNKARSYQRDSQGINDVNAIDLNSMIEKLPSEAEYSYFEKGEQFNKYLNSLDITIENKYTTSSQLFEFSIKIPKAKIASQKNSDFSTLSIGVFTNKIEEKINTERGQGQSQGMRNGGGRRGNGSGRGGMKGQNGQRPSTTTEKVTVDFWFDAK